MLLNIPQCIASHKQELSCLKCDLCWGWETLTFRINCSVIFSSLSVSPITYYSPYQETHPPVKGLHSLCSMVSHPWLRKEPAIKCVTARDRGARPCPFSRKGPCLSLPHYSCSAGLRLPIIKSWAGRGLSDPPVQLPPRRTEGAASPPALRTQHADRFLSHTEEKERGLRKNAEKETIAQTPACEVPVWQCSIFSSTFLKRHPASSFLQCPSILSNSFGFPCSPKVAVKFCLGKWSSFHRTKKDPS